VTQNLGSGQGGSGGAAGSSNAGEDTGQGSQHGAGQDSQYDALVVVSFGGPEGPDDVIPFLENVTRGRNIPKARLEEVAEIYKAVGGVSPLNDQNRALVEQLERVLRERGNPMPVYLGNRNWHPFLADTAKKMRQDGVKRALGFVTSAFSSYSSCRQYLEDIAQACAAADGLEIHKLRAFHNHPSFVELQTQATADAAGALLRQGLPLASLRIIFTAHSLPQDMAVACDYEQQLREVASLVMDSIDWQRLAADHSATATRNDSAETAAVGQSAQPHGWDLVWQSRSGPPHVKWLEPDIGDHLPAVAFYGRGPLRAGRCRGVVVVPLGFLSDHMEVINDLDQVARQIAADFKLAFERAATVGSSERFADLVADLVDERMSGSPERPHLGKLAVSPDFCAPDCCVG